MERLSGLFSKDTFFCRIFDDTYKTNYDTFAVPGCRRPAAGRPLPDSCASDKIDRKALVSRNNPHISELAPLNSLNLGNGCFTLTLDATGLQTFPEFCKDGLSLGTYSEWGWHAFPNTEGYTMEETLEDHPLPGHPHGIYSVQMGYAQSPRSQAAAAYIRANPHRIHLGNIGFDGMKPEEIEGVDQTLDMYDGVLHSKFTWKGQPVQVETVSGGEGEDLLAAHVKAEQPLPVVLRFPYPTGVHTDDASDWCVDDKHSTEIVSQQDGSALVRRTLDDVTYYVSVRWSGKAALAQAGPNRLTLTPESPEWEFSVRFTPEQPDGANPDFRTAAASAKGLWNNYWQTSGVIDFSHCTDPRAPLLERRVVLSQYLMRVQEAQQLPAAGDGPDLQLLVRQVPHGDDLVAPGPFPALGTAGAPAPPAGLVQDRPAERPHHRGAPGLPRRTLDEDDGPVRHRSPLRHRLLHHLAAAAPDLHGGAHLPRRAFTGDPG